MAGEFSKVRDRAVQSSLRAQESVLEAGTFQHAQRRNAARFSPEIGAGRPTTAGTSASGGVLTVSGCTYVVTLRRPNASHRSGPRRQDNNRRTHRAAGEGPGTAKFLLGGVMAPMRVFG
jgi:hypothetical protein